MAIGLFTLISLLAFVGAQGSQYGFQLHPNTGIKVGAYQPQYDPATGQLRPMQCHGSTGSCWCVDANGRELTQKVRGDDIRYLRCNPHPATDSPHRVGQYVPQRDGNGNLLAMQCHGSTGYCWCADTNGRALTQQVRDPTQLNCDAERQRGSGSSWNQNRRVDNERLFQ